jgi:6-phosphogluconolactonase (cycloisomerase 2 family)
MNRKPSRFILLAVSMVCILVVAACNCAPTLQYLVITPTTSTIAVGTTQQYTANGYYSNGSITPGLSVTWGSATPAVATINSSTGVATGVAVGTSTISAFALGITTTATLNVNQLTSIAITPLNQTIPVAGTEQYDAMGTFSNGSGTPTTSDITSQVTWNAGTATVASFSTTTPGLATGLAAGTTTINATLDGVTSNTTNLTVGSASTLVITATPSTIAVGNSTSFTVLEMDGGGTPHPPTNPVTWTSATPVVANVVANGTAAATGAGFTPGTTVITATESSTPPITGTLTLTVVAGTSKFAYVSNVTDETIGVYTATATTSPYLTANGSPVNDPPVLPRQILPSPNGQYAYVIGEQSYCSVYTITNGIPAFIPNSQLIGGAANWNYGAIDPYGRFIFEIDSGDGTGTYPNGTIYAFTINQTNGAITTVPGSPFTTNLSSGRSLVIDHSGQYLYATNYGNNTISAYQINQSTGALTPLSAGATIPTGKGPEIATLDPTGTYLYVANKTDNSVSSYSIGAGGVLTSLGPDTVVIGALSLINVKVAPNGNYLYVLDAGTPLTTPAVPGAVYGFTLTSGVPGATPITGTPIATEIAPTGMAIDPTSALIAVDNSGSNAISLFTIGSGGALTSQTPVATGNLPLFVIFSNTP